MDTSITTRPDDFKRPAASKAKDSGSRWNRSKIATAAISLIVGAAIAFAAFEFQFPARVPAAMRGKWMVVDGEGMKGATLEFFRNGTIVLTTLDTSIDPQGHEFALTGQVEVTGNRFRVIVSDDEFARALLATADAAEKRKMREEAKSLREQAQNIHTINGYKETLAQDILELTDRLFVTQDVGGQVVMFMERVSPDTKPGSSEGSGQWPRKSLPK